MTDDGSGMPGAERLGPRGDGLEGGFGMSGMRERAELVGGELSFMPAPGGGTIVQLSVPLAGTTAGLCGPGLRRFSARPRRPGPSAARRR